MSIYDILQVAVANLKNPVFLNVSLYSRNLRFNQSMGSIPSVAEPLPYGDVEIKS
jgi:hypothetical protein